MSLSSRVLDAMPSDLSSIPGTHVVANCLRFCSDLHMCLQTQHTLESLHKCIQKHTANEEH